LCFYPEKTDTKQTKQSTKYIAESHEPKVTTEIRELQSDLEKYSKTLQQVVLKLDGHHHHTNDFNKLGGMFVKFPSPQRNSNQILMYYLLNLMQHCPTVQDI
jgi:hypothetical protein